MSLWYQDFSINSERWASGLVDARETADFVHNEIEKALCDCASEDHCFGWLPSVMFFGLSSPDALVNEYKSLLLQHNGAVTAFKAMHYDFWPTGSLPDDIVRELSSGTRFQVVDVAQEQDTADTKPAEFGAALHPHTPSAVLLLWGPLIMAVIVVLGALIHWRINS